MSTPLGRKTSVEVSLDSTSFVDITKENRSDFTVTTPEPVSYTHLTLPTILLV